MARDDYKRILKRRVGQIEEELDPELGIRENMVNAYLKSFQKKSREEAEQTADKLLKGILDFQDNLAAYQQEGLEGILQAVDSAMEGKSDSEKYALCLNMIVAVKSMDQKLLETLFGSERFQADTTFEELKGAEIGSDVQITEGMLEEAREELKKALESSAITLNDIETLSRIPQDQLEGYARDFAIGSWSYEERKAYLALAAYMAYEDGELSLQEETDPYSWAVVMAAAVETEKTVKDASLGRITWERASQILKGIGMVLLAMGMMYIIWAASGALIAAIGMAAGILNQLIVSAVGLWIVLGMMDTFEEPLKWFGAGFDRVKEFLENHYEPVKEGIFSAFRFVRDKVAAGYGFVKAGAKNLVSRWQTVET